MFRRTINLMMALIAAGGMWDVSFPADPQNTAIVIVTTCRGGGNPPFYAYDYFPITAEDQDRMTVRRQPVPAGCSVEADLMRASDDDPNHEWVADSVTITN